MSILEEQLEETAVIAQLRARINTLTVGAAPSGPAGGDLNGSYPNPQIAAGAIVDADVNGGAAIAESKLALATDAAAGIGSRRTLGAGALQAAAGNDPRLSDSRNPTGPAGGDLAGTFPNPELRKPAAHQAWVAVTTNVNIAAPGATLDTATFSTAGPRVLLLGQTTASQNGLWVWQGAAVPMTRPLDWLLNEVKPPGQVVAIGLGTSQGKVFISQISATVDTDNPVFVASTAAPIGTAGGDLTGSYPNPSVAAGAITDAKVAAAAAIAESKLNLATDAAAGVGSRRTLGTGALQAAAGNDSRLSDPRAPTGAAGGKLTGTYPNPGLVGLQDVDFIAACIDGLATRASLRTLGTLAQQACSGADARLSDSRTPSGAAGGDLAATFPNPTLRKPAAHQVVVATQTNVNIASPGATIDTATFSTAGPRVLLFGQTTVSQNGIWVWNGAAVPLTRPDDWLLNEIKPAGQLVSIGSGTYATRAVISSVNATVDTDNPLFTFLGPTGAAGGDLGGTYPNPTVLLAGDGTQLLRTGNVMAPIAPIDASSTGIAGTVSVRSKSLARIVKASLAGDGATTVWTITHNLSSFQLVVGGNDPSTGVPIELDWFHLTTNSIRVTYTPALAAGDYLYVTIVG